MFFRLVFLIVPLIMFASWAGAVTIDDFTNPFPLPGTVQTDATGFGSVSQSGLASVLGTDRDTEVRATVPASPTDAQIIANTDPPPFTDVVALVMGGGGGSLKLSYPGLTSYDMTLGGGSSVPSSMIVVRSTLMVSAASLGVTLSDTFGTAATASLSTVDYSGTGDHAYLFPVDPATFTTAGLDLSDIDELAVELASSFGQDFEISDISVVPISPKTTNWGETFAFQPASGLTNPAVLVGFGLVPPEPCITDVTVDISDPMQPKIVIPCVPPTPVLEFRMAPYGGLVSLRSTVVDGNHFEFGITNGVFHKVVVDVSSSSGHVINPGSLVGFNPQPEPPNPGDIVGFNPQPEPPEPGASVGFQFNMEAPGGAFAGSAAADETITLAFQILDGSSAPIEFDQVAGASVPLSSNEGLFLLCLALMSFGLFAQLRRNGGLQRPRG
jgi:hypothetical protein